MSNMDNAVNQLIAAIMETEIYQEYATQLERVKQQPELKARIDHFREQSYILQTEGDVAIDKFDQFESEFDEVNENPDAVAFLTSELAFCKMMQDINLRVTEAIHFE